MRKKKILVFFLAILTVSCGNREAPPEEQELVIEKKEDIQLEAQGSVSDESSESESESASQGEGEQDPFTAIVDGYQSITWWNLLSSAELEYYRKMNEAYAEDPSFVPETDPPPVDVNQQVNNKKVRIPGYVVGVDTDPDNFSKVRSFLFVPYQGACIHVPPPPANQTIFTTLGEAVESNPYRAYWLYGEISVEGGNNDLAEFSYTFTGDRLELYQPGV